MIRVSYPIDPTVHHLQKQRIGRISARYLNGEGGDIENEGKGGVSTVTNHLVSDVASRHGFMITGWRNF